MNTPTTLTLRNYRFAAGWENGSTIDPSHIDLVPIDVAVSSVVMDKFRQFLATEALTSNRTDAPEEVRADWRETASRQLDDFAALGAGWDGYDASPISDEIRREARVLIDRFAVPGSPPASVVPTVNGTVQIEWHTRICDAEIEILAPGHTHVFCRHVESGTTWEAELSLEQAVDRVRGILG